MKDLNKFLKRMNSRYEYNETSLEDLRRWVLKNKFKDEDLGNLYDILSENWVYESGPKFPAIFEINKLWNKYKYQFQKFAENWIDKCYRENDSLSVEEIINRIHQYRENKDKRGYFFSAELDFISCFNPIPFCYEILKNRGLDENKIEKYIRSIIENNLKKRIAINYREIKKITTAYSPENLQRKGMQSAVEVVKEWEDL